MHLPQFDSKTLTADLPPVLLKLYAAYLEIDDLARMRCDYEIFREPGVDTDAIDELWDLPCPERFTCDLELTCPSIGAITLGRYGGRKIILEQNTSPILVYWKND